MEKFEKFEILLVHSLEYYAKQAIYRLWVYKFENEGSPYQSSRAPNSCKLNSNFGQMAQASLQCYLLVDIYVSEAMWGDEGGELKAIQWIGKSESEVMTWNNTALETSDMHRSW